MATPTRRASEETGGVTPWPQPASLAGASGWYGRSSLSRYRCDRSKPIDPWVTFEPPVALVCHRMDDSCGQINPFFPARRRPTVDRSLVAGGAQRQGLQTCPNGIKRLHFFSVPPSHHFVNQHPEKQVALTLDMGPASDMMNGNTLEIVRPRWLRRQLAEVVAKLNKMDDKATSWVFLGPRLQGSRNPWASARVR